MRSLTLPWSGLKAHSLPSSASYPKASKSCGSNLFPFNSLCKNQTSTSKKLSLRNPYLNFSRELCRDPGASCENRNDVDCKNCKMTRESVHNLANDSGLIKFVMFFGLLTLQGSQTAVAAVDFASGLQSFPFLGDLGDISRGFASALLAARNSAATVFAGTFGALAAMTVISVILGRTFHYVDEILPFRFGQTDLPIDDIAAVCLLVYFGVSTLLDAASTDGLKSEDEQKEAELAVSEFSGNGAGIIAAASTIISTFTLVFVAEWGDKSFFSTIALAAASSPLGVIGGALAGHVVATLLAVLGGSLLGTFLSEKAIAYIGGVLFLFFAAVTVIEIVS
ncbi:protein PAM71 [Citrus sinensis]|uniref:Protein PAM71 n=1 Tax=Citrus sinensis TaxID=2711 RepID=A0ACB8LP31_CITSI|nr:protein PAM71 [Citrus sinensis]